MFMAALDQGSSAELAAALMNMTGALSLVRIGHARHNPEITGQALLIGKIVHLADDTEQNRAGNRADPFDAGQAGVALEFRAGLGDRFL